MSEKNVLSHISNVLKNKNTKIKLSLIVFIQIMKFEDY